MVEYEKMDTVYFAMDKVKSLNPLSSQEEEMYFKLYQNGVRSSFNDYIISGIYDCQNSIR